MRVFVQADKNFAGAALAVPGMLLHVAAEEDRVMTFEFFF